MNKYTKKFYENLKTFMSSPSNLEKLGRYYRSDNVESSQIAMSFWKQYRKDVSKKNFYEMISDPHWKYVPTHSYYNNAGKKTYASILISHLCKNISKDLNKSKKVLSKAEGVWATMILMECGAHVFSRKLLSKKIKSNDSRVYKRVLPYVSRNIIIKHIEEDGIPKSKKRFLTCKLSIMSDDDILEISSWKSWSSAWHSFKRVNSSNAQAVINMLSENMEEITKGQGQWYQRRLNYYIASMISYLDDKDILFYVDNPITAKIIKSRVLLSDIL